jgi:hypothetical protein
MKSASVLDHQEASRSGVAIEPAERSAGFARRAGRFLLREFLELLPPTIFFMIGFNLILLTTNLILANYGEQFSSYLLATGGALIVGKAVLVASAMRSIRRYDRAPLVRPILFKTLFYWVAVFAARLLEHWIKYWLAEHHPLGTFLPHMVATFSWNRFIAIQLWILVLFLIYVTASELNHLFGEGELRHLLLTSRPSELPLNRRQRISELVRLSQLADNHSLDEFRDPTSVAHNQLIDIVRRLAVEPRPHPADQDRAAGWVGGDAGRS